MQFSLFPFVAFAAATCCAQSPSGQAAKAAPVAVVEGRPILENELLPLIQGQLRRLQFEEYELRYKALEDLINQNVVAVKARDKGITSEEFLRQEVDDKLAQPSEAELQRYYSSQRNLSNLRYEQVKDQLLPILKQQKVERERQDYIHRLRKQAHVSVMLQPPRVDVGYDPARVLGTPGAPVTIVEFSDFQCPYCRKANATLEQVLQKYKGRVRLAFRDFPLTQIHPRAQRAAEAARCASEQGQFWAYHDLVFAAPDKLSDQDLSQRARSLRLDLALFETCLESGKFKANIEEDLREGMQAGVSATPGFFINGMYVSGSQSLATFEDIIDDELLSLKRQAN